MDTKNLVEVCNLTDVQLLVVIVDAYGNRNSLMAQPYGKFHLPEGVTVAEPVNSSIRVTLPVRVTAAESSIKVQQNQKATLFQAGEQTKEA